MFLKCVAIKVVVLSSSWETELLFLVTCEVYFLFRLRTGVVSMMLISPTPIWFLETFLMIDFVHISLHIAISLYPKSNTVGFSKNESIIPQNCEVSENSGGPYTRITDDTVWLKTSNMNSKQHFYSYSRI